MAAIGYVRISSVDQNPDRQIEAIGDVDKLFIDRASGKDTHRPQLEALRAYVRDGSDDVVKVMIASPAPHKTYLLSSRSSSPRA